MENPEERLLRTKGKEYIEKRNAAAAKFAEGGALAATFEEHSFFGTPPDIQRGNPGKTLAELMNDDEILDLLRRSAEALAYMKKEAPQRGPQWEGVLERGIEQMKRDMRYLDKIGRLPEEFKIFDVDAIEPEK
ncbi:MAG: hypothetical protein Q8L09_05370 [Candidatus Moranbacteria bacterium]|nr:hypothetical protein [Candidatus Moranbacteria bacterium]